MRRLAAALRVDFVNQWRNRLYAIGIGVGLLLAVMQAWLAPVELWPQIIPALMLAVLGGSTMMYVAAMIVFERDEQTLAANIVSPLRTTEYLGAKIGSLGFLASLEAVVMVWGGLLIKSRFAEVGLPKTLPVIAGIVLLGMIFILAGIVLVVRYRSITEFLLPMAGVSVISQLPILYFLDLWPNSWLLVIPTGAPAMLIRGGFLGLDAWQWVYAVGYSAAVLVALLVWAHCAFQKYVVRKAG